MSSVHRDRDRKCWFCHFYDPLHFRRNRTTGTNNVRIASTICNAIEHGARLAEDGKLSNEKALKMIRETRAAIEETHGKIPADNAERVLTQNLQEFVALAGGELVTFSIRGWLTSWIDGRTDATQGTRTEYRKILDNFLKHLGTRADRPLTTLQMRQIEDYKQKLIERVAPSTVNKAVKVLKACLADAVRKRQLEFSPAQHVEAVEVDASQRRPFERGEIKKLLAVATGDWRTMILIALYTGLRLRDCANLTWREIHLDTATIELPTQKTGRRVGIPISEYLAAHFGKLAGDVADAPLCPTLHGKPASWLSARFYEVMVQAGIVEARGHERTGTGRDGKRQMNRISFHSFRYNVTSALKSSGVSDAVAMDIVGHETEAVSRNYTKISETAKREAMSKLPDWTK
jgi:integrase